MKKILVVDDEKEIATLLEKILVQNDYFVKSTVDPSEAIDLLKNNDFDVAIVDLKMPKISGLELLGIIKKDFPKVETIIITANATVETAVECLKNGADDYLIKPFETGVFLATVAKTLEVKEIKSQLVSLKEMDKMKDEFISTISHELKTPLTVISAAAELVMVIRKINMQERRHQRRRQKDKELVKLYEMITSQTARMKKLINDILDFAKIAAGFLEIKKENCEISKLILNTIKEMQPLADTKKIEITYMFFSSDDIYVNCDYHRIGQVLINILSNAIKYTGVGGKVCVNVSLIHSSESGVCSKDKNSELRIPNYIQISISDTGKGIDAVDIEKVFEKFYRVDQSLTREEGGFGLGLSICKNIVKLHGGKIYAESDGLGKGSKFVFMLPM